MNGINELENVCSSRSAYRPNGSSVPALPGEPFCSAGGPSRVAEACGAGRCRALAFPGDRSSAPGPSPAPGLFDAREGRADPKFDLLTGGIVRRAPTFGRALARRQCYRVGPIAYKNHLQMYLILQRADTVGKNSMLLRNI